MVNDPSTNKLIADLSRKFDDKFAVVGSKLGTIDSEFKKIDSRFDRLETSLDFVKMDIKNLGKQAEKIDKRNEKRYNKVMNHVDSLAKGFKKFDEEQVLLSAHSKKHTDRIEKLEKKVFEVVQI